MLSNKGALLSVQFGGCVQTAQSFSSSMSEDTGGCGGDGRVTCRVQRRQRNTLVSFNNSLQGPQKSQESPRFSQKVPHNTPQGPGGSPSRSDIFRALPAPRLPTEPLGAHSLYQITNIRVWASPAGLGHTHLRTAGYSLEKLTHLAQ